MDTSVLWLVKRANQHANSQNIACVLVNKFAEVFNKFMGRMVPIGVNGFSVPFDVIGNTERLVSKAEEKRIG